MRGDGLKGGWKGRWMGWTHLLYQGVVPVGSGRAQEEWPRGYTAHQPQCWIVWALSCLAQLLRRCHSSEMSARSAHNLCNLL